MTAGREKVFLLIAWLLPDAMQVKAAAAAGETPWEQPCKWELQVALERLLAAAPAEACGHGTSVMFLLDGSGSVTEGMQ